MHDIDKDIELSKYRYALAKQNYNNAKMKREESDYSDFFIASADEAQTQIQSVEYMLPLIKEYLAGHGVEIM